MVWGLGLADDCNFEAECEWQNAHYPDLPHLSADDLDWATVAAPSAAGEGVRPLDDHTLANCTGKSHHFGRGV